MSALWIIILAAASLGHACPFFFSLFEQRLVTIKFLQQQSIFHHIASLTCFVLELKGMLVNVAVHVIACSSTKTKTKSKTKTKAFVRACTLEFQIEDTAQKI